MTDGLSRVRNKKVYRKGLFFAIVKKLLDKRWAVITLFKI